MDALKEIAQTIAKMAEDQGMSTSLDGSVVTITCQLEAQPEHISITSYLPSEPNYGWRLLNEYNDALSAASRTLGTKEGVHHMAAAQNAWVDLMRYSPFWAMNVQDVEDSMPTSVKLLEQQRIWR